VKVSLQAAQALPTLLAERDCATANTWLWPNLHHTCLEPPNREPVGECTSQCRHCRHLLSPLWRLAKVSGDARPDGRLPACAWGDVARGLNPYPSHYRTAFASSIFPFPHIYRLALRLAFPCVQGCHVPSQSHTNGLGALCPPVACNAHDKERGSPCTRYSALLAQAFQHLWLVFFDDVYQAFTWVRHTIHPSPVSVVMLTDTSAPHGCDASLVTVGSLSEGAVRVVAFPHISVGYR